MNRKKVKLVDMDEYDRTMRLLIEGWYKDLFPDKKMPATYGKAKTEIVTYLEPVSLWARIKARLRKWNVKN